MRVTMIVVSLLLASSLFAAPVITSVTPNRGPVEGGTTVIIKGSGFSDICITCSAPFKATPEVTFFGTPAASVKMIDSTTLEAVTPPHLPGRVPVTARQFDGSEPYTLPDAFEFTGDINEAFDPILFPILSPPVRGAFGSEFHTRARIWNSNRTDWARVYGIDTSCSLAGPPVYPQLPYNLPPHGAEYAMLPDCSSSLGRILWVPKGTTIAANLRVSDVTREAASHGVEIPVPRREDLSNELALIGVPVDPRFRNTLRIYGLEAARVLVSFLAEGRLLETRTVDLTAGANLFEPALATITTFPATTVRTMTITVDSLPPCAICPLPHVYPPVWAFVTVTNNDTQQITTVTPN